LDQSRGSDAHPFIPFSSYSFSEGTLELVARLLIDIDKSFIQLVLVSRNEQVTYSDSWCAYTSL